MTAYGRILEIRATGIATTTTIAMNGRTAQQIKA